MKNMNRIIFNLNKKIIIQNNIIKRIQKENYNELKNTNITIFKNMTNLYEVNKKKIENIKLKIDKDTNIHNYNIDKIDNYITFINVAFCSIIIFICLKN